MITWTYTGENKKEIFQCSDTKLDPMLDFVEDWH